MAVAEPVTRRVLLAAADARFRQAARALISQHAGFTVVGEAGTAAETVDMAALLQSNVVLLELGLPGQSTPALVSALRALPSRPRVVILAWDDSDEYRRAAEQAGASLCVSKTRLDKLFVALSAM